MNTTNDDGISLHQIKIVVWSAPEDLPFWLQFSHHLEALKYRKLITLWHPQEILPGVQVREAFNARLQEADLILLLVSSYLLPDICGNEMEQVWQRCSQGDVTVVPVLLRPCDYQGTPISQMLFLPEKDKAITQWSNRQAAMREVAKGIRHVVETLLTQRWEATGDSFYEQRQYEYALQAYEQSLAFNPTNISLYAMIGKVYFSLTQFENALVAYEVATQFFPHNSSHREKGEIFLRLGRFKEAIEAYEQAIFLKPDFGLAYQGHGKALAARARQLSDEYKKQARESYAKARLLNHSKERMRGENK